MVTRTVTLLIPRGPRAINPRGIIGESHGPWDSPFPRLFGKFQPEMRSSFSETVSLKLSPHCEFFTIGGIVHD